jgi:hypothetical protein
MWQSKRWSQKLSIVSYCLYSNLDAVETIHFIIRYWVEKYVLVRHFVAMVGGFSRRTWKLVPQKLPLFGKLAVYFQIFEWTIALFFIFLPVWTLLGHLSGQISDPNQVGYVPCCGNRKPPRLNRFLQLGSIPVAVTALPFDAQLIEFNCSALRTDRTEVNDGKFSPWSANKILWANFIHHLVFCVFPVRRGSTIQLFTKLSTFIAWTHHHFEISTTLLSSLSLDLS